MTRHILVVEDDIHGQQITKSVLEYSGFIVDTASDAEQALQFIEQQIYRVAIIDLSLPGRSGWELLEEILTQYSPSEFPCIAITAYHSTRVAQQALEAGFVGYFSKPIDIEVFVDQISQYLVESD